VPRAKNPIDPALTGPVVPFAQALRERRERAGNPSLDYMARTGYISKSTLSVADRGDELPTWDATVAYLRGCRVTDEVELEQWRERWEAVAAEIGKTPGKPRPKMTVQSPASAPPSPRDITTVRDLRRRLREVRVWAGDPSYQQMSEQAHKQGKRLARSTIGDLLGKKMTLPKVDTVLAYLVACGVPEEEHGSWIEAHRRSAVNWSRELTGTRPHRGPDRDRWPAGPPPPKIDPRPAARRVVAHSAVERRAPAARRPQQRKIHRGPRTHPRSLTAEGRISASASTTHAAGRRRRFPRLSLPRFSLLPSVSEVRGSRRWALSDDPWADLPIDRMGDDERGQAGGIMLGIVMVISVMVVTGIVGIFLLAGARKPVKATEPSRDLHTTVTLFVHWRDEGRASLGRTDAGGGAILPRTNDRPAADVRPAPPAGHAVP